ncbi:putative vacuolar fusion protein Ccz1 [Septoria linicola]|nr:putative vacuolar fusion protein Ccz1 [Septoria linicola]
MSSPQWQNSVVPARLSLLAIYNPSLGLTDETFPEQAVFYYSRKAHEARQSIRKNARNDAAGGDAAREEENEKLRQIGLAQGMIDFARTFSGGQAVDSIDTEKSRIVLHELEAGWWILASIDLTRLPGVPTSTPEPTKKGAEKPEPKTNIEYSAREVSPPALLIQQLIQAHHIFSLHHGPSLNELYVRLPRTKFCNILDRYWARFSRTWDVLLHGSPATDIFSGIKLSSGGELGMGVGEEDWGSGERVVLEDLVRRTEGLVDVVAARFGDEAPPKEVAVTSDIEALPWMGGGNYPIASDGIVFGGVGSISKPSLRNVSLWMRQIYTYGEYAYGVRDNPLRERKKRRRRQMPVPDAGSDFVDESDPRPKVPAVPDSTVAKDFGKPNKSPTLDGADGDSNDEARSTARPGIPPPIVSAAETSLNNATRYTKTAAVPVTLPGNDTTLGVPDQYMKYLTFGISTLVKSGQQKRPEAPRRTSTSSSKTMTEQRHAASRLPKHEALPELDEADLTQVEPIPEGQTLQDKIAMQKRLEQQGHFIVGLKGDLDSVPENSDVTVDDTKDEEFGGLRNVLRTIHVQLSTDRMHEQERTSLQRKLSDAGLPAGVEGFDDFKRHRVLIYVHRPFMYCLLFEHRTPSLAVASFYKDMHRNLMPIHKPLLSSTSYTKVAQRIDDAQASSSDTASIMSGQSSSSMISQPSPIYDLLYDPALLTVHTSIPNIAEPGTPAAEGILTKRSQKGSASSAVWTRIEALNVHSQILNTLSSVKRSTHEYERTSKTNRGWWVVWMKLPPSSKEETEANPQSDAEPHADPNMPSFRVDPPNDKFGPPPLPKEDSGGTIVPPSTRHASTMTRQPPPSMNRIAFLVRKASDANASAAKSSSAGSRAASSMWSALTLRPTSMSDENTGGTGAGWGPSALTGGIGFDPRKYVEGLLSLNR